MTAAKAARLAPAGAPAERAIAPSGRAGDDLGAFLDAVAVVLRETVTRFEESVGRITESVVVHARGVDKSLIVSLQDFDRLQQEFIALSDVIAHFAATSDSHPVETWAERHGYKAIAAISVADLKARFLRHLEGATAHPASPEAADDVVF